MRTEKSDEDLKLIRETGMSQSEATRWALKVAANLLRFAWEDGYADRGEMPDMRVQYRAKEVSR
ncbi:hypothetical protein ABZ353_10600 [Streptomyces niveus]|uniref:hypothetical protein n=1 Tax=Streptomyces niveus TaxID=193462 RepID=UPI0033C62CE5